MSENFKIKKFNKEFKQQIKIVIERRRKFTKQLSDRKHHVDIWKASVFQMST